jgi:hypothetical protein
MESGKPFVVRELDAGMIKMQLNDDLEKNAKTRVSFF